MTFRKISENKYIGIGGCECLRNVYEARGLKVTVYCNAHVIDVDVDISDPDVYLRYYADGNVVPKFVVVRHTDTHSMEALVKFPEMLQSKAMLEHLANKILPEVNITLTALNALLEHIRKEPMP